MWSPLLLALPLSVSISFQGMQSGPLPSATHGESPTRCPGPWLSQVDAGAELYAGMSCLQSRRGGRQGEPTQPLPKGVQHALLARGSIQSHVCTFAPFLPRLFLFMAGAVISTRGKQKRSRCSQCRHGQRASGRQQSRLARRRADSKACCLHSLDSSWGRGRDMWRRSRRSSSTRCVAGASFDGSARATGTQLQGQL